MLKVTGTNKVIRFYTIELYASDEFSIKQINLGSSRLDYLTVPSVLPYHGHMCVFIVCFRGKNKLFIVIISHKT